MFDPREFHAFAVRCAQDTSDEAACRSAISRAYYAAYLVAHNYVRETGVRAIPQPGKRRGPHEHTIHAIATIRHPGARYVSDELGKLKRRRIDADYHPEYNYAQVHVAKALSDAAMIIAWFDALP